MALAPGSVQPIDQAACEPAYVIDECSVAVFGFAIGSGIVFRRLYGRSIGSCVASFAGRPIFGDGWINNIFFSKRDIVNCRGAARTAIGECSEYGSAANPADHW